MSIPLLLLVVLAYNAMALTGIADVAQPVLRLRLVSGVRWSLTVGDLAIVAGVVLLAADILKAVRRWGRRSFLDPLLSLTLFAIVLLQFLLMPAFASSAFFILALLCLVDAGAGILLAAAAPPPPRHDREPL